MGAYHLTWFVIILPLLGALMSFLAETRRRAAQVCAVFSLLTLFCAATVLVLRLTHPQQPPFFGFISFFAMSPPEASTFPTRLEPQLGIQVDALSVSIGAAIAFVLAVTQAWAVTWLRGEDAYRRFFWSTSLLGFFALAFVFSPNTFQSLFMWVGITACVYIAALHRADQPRAAAPARTVLVLLRASDVALLLGVVYALNKFGAYASLQPATPGQTTFDPFEFGNVAQSAGAVLHGQVPGSGPRTLVVLSILFAFAIAARAAQLPFQAWLTRLASAPLPVLALAGTTGALLSGLLLARLYATLVLVPNVFTALALTGGAGALIAGLVALTQRDIVRIVACLATAEAALVLVGFGGGGYSQAADVLFIAVFFVTLLALAAGNLVRAYRTRDILEMGGAWRRMRTTSIGLGVAVAGIAGLSLTSYWAMAAVLRNGGLGSAQHGVAARALIVVLTALAMIGVAAAAVRVLLHACRGEVVRRRAFQAERVREVEPPLRRVTFIAALAAVASVIVSLPGIPAVHSGKTSIPGMTFTHFVFTGARRQDLPVEWLALLLAIAAAGIGVAVALAMARMPTRDLVPAGLRAAAGDDALDLRAGGLVTRGALALAALDVRVIDEVADAVGDMPSAVTLALARLRRAPRAGYLASGVVVVAVAVLLSVLAATGHLWVRTA